MSNGVPQDDAMHRRARNLARGIAEAYAEAAPGPEMDNPAKASLITPVAARLRAGLSIGLDHSHIGGYVGETIQEWERTNGREPGPHYFQVSPHDEVAAIGDQRPWRRKGA